MLLDKLVDVMRGCYEPIKWSWFSEQKLLFCEV